MRFLRTTAALVLTGLVGYSTASAQTASDEFIAFGYGGDGRNARFDAFSQELGGAYVSANVRKAGEDERGIHPEDLISATEANLEYGFRQDFDFLHFRNYLSTPFVQDSEGLSGLGETSPDIFNEAGVNLREGNFSLDLLARACSGEGGYCNKYVLSGRPGIRIGGNLDIGIEGRYQFSREDLGRFSIGPSLNLYGEGKKDSLTLYAEKELGSDSGEGVVGLRFTKKF